MDTMELAVMIERLLCLGFILAITVFTVWIIWREEHYRPDLPELPESNKELTRLASLAFAMSKATGPVQGGERYILDRVIEQLSRLEQEQKEIFLNYILCKARGEETDEVPSLEQARELLAGDRGLLYEVYGMINLWTAG